MARYLVTGGCGFVGRHLCKRLIAQGDQVVVLDNLSNSELSNLVPGCEFFQGDVRVAEDVASATEGTDGVFHLAAVASVELCNQHWRDSHLTNQSGSVTVFQEAVKLGVKRVVYASSAAIYGDNEEVPLEETATPAPLTAYGVDKLGTEHHASVAFRVHGLPTIGIRPFNIFGTGQDPRSPYSGVISIFLSQLRADGNVRIHGDGLQSRDFIHVSDTVETFLAAMKCPLESATVVNAATGRTTTISELLALISSILRVEPRVEQSGTRVGDIRRSQGSTKRMESLLGIKARVSLEEGLKAMISDMQPRESFRERNADQRFCNE